MEPRTTDRPTPTAVEVFLALDPVLLEPLTMVRDRTKVAVNTKALHDLMLAHQVHRIAAGALGTGED